MLQKQSKDLEEARNLIEEMKAVSFELLRLPFTVNCVFPKAVFV